MNMCNFRVFIILLVFFLHGCTSVTIEPSVKKTNDNTYHGKHDLFAKLVKIKGKYILQNVTPTFASKNEPWIRLNDLKPMFITQLEKDCYLGTGILSIGANINGTICKTNHDNLFRTEEGDAAQNIVSGLVLLASFGTTGTGRLTNIVFDRNQYEKAVSEALASTKINREELLRIHDDLWVEWEAEKTSYANKNDFKPHIKVIDKSGLYKNNEVDFSKFVTIKERKLTNPDNEFLLDNLTSNALGRLIIIEVALRNLWRKEQENYLVTCKSGEKNGINYVIDCPEKIDKKDIAVPVSVTILSKNIQKLIPNNFVGRDKNLEVQILNGEVVARNLTSIYISLNSLSIYYMDKISTKTFLNLELPPYSEKNISINNFTYKLPNMSRTRYTSNDAKNEIIKYGFAAKYTSSNKNIEKTLHKTQEYTGLQLATFENKLGGD